MLAKIFSLFLSGQIKMCLECGIVQRIFRLRNITKKRKIITIGVLLDPVLAFLSIVGMLPCYQGNKPCKYPYLQWRQTSGCRGCRCIPCFFGLEVSKSRKYYIMTKYRDTFFIIPAMFLFYFTKYILLNKSRSLALPLFRPVWRLCISMWPKNTIPKHSQ